MQTPNPGDAVTRIDAGQRMGSLASSSSSRVFRLFHAATAVNPAKCIQDSQLGFAITQARIWKLTVLFCIQCPNRQVMVSSLVADFSLGAVLNLRLRHDGQQQVLPVRLHPAVSGEGLSEDESKNVKSLTCMCAATDNVPKLLAAEGEHWCECSDVQLARWSPARSVSMHLGYRYQVCCFMAMLSMLLFGIDRATQSASQAHSDSISRPLTRSQAECLIIT